MIKGINKVIYLLLITSISSCYTYQTAEIRNAKVDEIVMFCGNPGVGKSTLCNSIFQQALFESGLSFSTGLTVVKQERIYEGKLYVDTPGLEDIEKQDQAAREIEAALKHNNNYKIIFVAKLDSGRIRTNDLLTINRICEAIKNPFEYGIVFNQVSKRVIEKMGQKQALEYLTKSTRLVKKPAAVVVLEEDEALKDEDNKYFQVNDGNRRKLLEFINNLKANKIEEKKVEKIDTRDMEVKINEMRSNFEEKHRNTLEERRRQKDNCAII